MIIAFHGIPMQEESMTEAMCLVASGSKMKAIGEYLYRLSLHGPGDDALRIIDIEQPTIRGYLTSPLPSAGPGSSDEWRDNFRSLFHLCGG